MKPLDIPNLTPEKGHFDYHRKLPKDVDADEITDISRIVRFHVAHVFPSRWMRTEVDDAPSSS